jgi:hypothetical protein
LQIVPVKPVQLPPQPLNVEPTAAVAVNVRKVPALTEVGQAEPPQAIVPDPVPETEVVTV